MGCPAEVEIGDNLVFSVTTHDPDTGVLTDADAVPPYRVYEDETGTAILTGNMAKLDDANTTGFYSELIACTVANGFEEGKTYTVYIAATVDSDVGGICYGFKAHTLRTDVDAIKVKTDTITAASVTVQSPVSADNDITIYSGDDYNSTNGANGALTWTIADYTGVDISGATASFKVLTADNFNSGTGTAALTLVPTISDAGSGTRDVTITLQMTAANTAALTSTKPPNTDETYYYDLRITETAKVSTNITGKLTVVDTIAAAA